jgi:hypothetical protein
MKTILLVLVLFTLGCDAKQATKSEEADITPLQADRILKNLNYDTIVDHCGQGKYSLADQQKFIKKQGERALSYPFGMFTFTEDGTELTYMGYKYEGKNTQWLNSRTPPKSLVKSILELDEISARGENISISEYEGKNAITILQLPCMYGLGSHR